MPFVLNGEPLAYGQDVEIDGFAYSYDTLTIMSAGDREALGVTWVEQEPVVPTVEQRLAALADLRWQKSQAFTYDGVLTQADPAIAVVNATLSMRERRGVPPEAPQTWKLSQADFRQWNEPQIEAFGFAIADHIQACFDREAVLTAMILSATDPASVHINTGWPS